MYFKPLYYLETLSFSDSTVIQNYISTLDNKICFSSFVP